MESRPAQKEGGNLLPFHHDPEKAQLLQAHYIGQPPSVRQEEDDRPRQRMPSPKHLLTTLILAFLVTFGLAAAFGPRNGMSCHDVGSHPDQLLAAEGQGPLPESGSKSFSELVNTVSPHSLHRILSTYFPNRYKHGVFESEHRAMEAVHADDAALATTLVQIAKRQDSNSTDSTSTTLTSSSTASTASTASSTSSTTTTTPTETPTTTPDTSTTTTPTPEPTTTTTITPSNTPTSPGQTSSTSTPPVTTASKTTSSSVSLKKTSTPVTATFTSTKPNGEVTVVTSTSFVEFDTPATSTGAAGSLQTEGAAPTPRIGALPALAGAILGGLVLI